MRFSWIAAGAALGVLYLLARKSKPGRSRLEVSAQELAAEGINAFGGVVREAAAGASVIWDQPTSSTGAPVLEGGAKGAAVITTRQYLIGQTTDDLRSIEPLPR